MFAFIMFLNAQGPCEELYPHSYPFVTIVEVHEVSTFAGVFGTAKELLENSWTYGKVDFVSIRAGDTRFGEPVATVSRDGVFY